MVTPSQKRHYPERKEQCDFTKVMIEEGDWIPKPSFDFNLPSVRESRAVCKESVFRELFNLLIFLLPTWFLCEDQWSLQRKTSA